MDLIFEILANFAYLLFALIGSFLPFSHTKNKKSSKKPVVIIHGWMGQNSLHYFMKRYLEKKGFAVYMTNFGLQLGDINKYSVNLNNFIEEKNLKNIILIGASEGGLIAFNYLQNFDGWSKTFRFISIATPFKGTLMAYLAPWSFAARQMTSNSEFVRRLFLRKVKNSKNILTISAKFDEFVSRQSSELKGANNKIVSRVGHAMIQGFSIEVFKLILVFAD